MKVYFKHIEFLLVMASFLPLTVYAQSFTDITQPWLDRGNDRIRIQPIDFFIDGANKYLIIEAGVLKVGARLMFDQAVAHEFTSEEVIEDQKSRSKLVLILDKTNKYIAHKIFYISKSLDIVKIKHREEKYFITTIGPSFEATIELYDDEGNYVNTLVDFDASNRVNLTDFDVKNDKIIFTGFFDQRAYIVFKTDTIKQEFQDYTDHTIAWFPVGFIYSMDVSSGEIIYSQGFGCATDPSSISSLIIDNQDNAIVAGNYNGSYFNFFGDTLPYRGGFRGDDAFIAKIDAAGEMQWVHSLSSNSFLDRINGVLVDDDNNVFAGALSRDEGKFYLDELEFNKNSYGYMMKFLAGGKLAWVKEFKGPAYDLVPISRKENIVFFGGSYQSPYSTTYLDENIIKHKSDEGVALFFKLDEDSGDVLNEVGMVSNGNRIDLMGAAQSLSCNMILFFNYKNNMDINGAKVENLSGLDFATVLASIDNTSVITEEAFNYKIKLVPNLLFPYERLQFNADSGGEFLYEIVNLEGKILLSNTISDKSYIDLADFQEGLYFMRIEKNKQIFSKHFFVNN